MKTLMMILLLGFAASTSALASITPVSLPSPPPVAAEETVGEITVEGQWG